VQAYFATQLFSAAGTSQTAAEISKASRPSLTPRNPTDSHQRRP
jgi:hypothetical protein